MKSLVKYLFVLMAAWSCSSDSSDEGEKPSGPSFSFQISGAVNKTISGTEIFFNETFTDVKDFEENDVTLSTLLIIAQDANTPCQVSFAVTQEGSVGSGNYPMGTDLFSFYNAFMNYSSDGGASISYQSDSGGIDIGSNGGGFVSGSVNVTLPGVGESEEAITITGSFDAEGI
ncbi:hypothetical protein [Flagellimonas eckloniae]|uniref:Uncharacterized protein n=1 Tax=Flagellimonas eckloniae TaxID=346185 RepID=A0A0Q1DN98_9FLAO|nr:hypothetical protein [Allomuricauda eckloniae]KQC30508.1 hypothetical protein AAY42_11975 [Allomuricauda eckloniae]